MTARRRWLTFTAAWLASAIVALFALTVPFGSSPLMFWATWLLFALVTFFGGAVLAILAGMAGRRATA